MAAFYRGILARAVLPGMHLVYFAGCNCGYAGTPKRAERGGPTAAFWTRLLSNSAAGIGTLSARVRLSVYPPPPGGAAEGTAVLTSEQLLWDISDHRAFISAESWSRPWPPPKGPHAPFGATFSEVWVVSRHRQWYAMPQTHHVTSQTPWYVVINKRPRGPWRKIAHSGFGLSEIERLFVPMVARINRKLGPKSSRARQGKSCLRLVFKSARYSAKTKTYRVVFLAHPYQLDAAKRATVRTLYQRFGHIEVVTRVSLAHGVKIYSETFGCTGGTAGKFAQESLRFTHFVEVGGIWVPRVSRFDNFDLGRRKPTNSWTLRLSHIRLNFPVKNSDFRYTPPVGAFVEDAITHGSYVVQGPAANLPGR